MARIEEITPIPIKGQRFATDIHFHGGKIHRGEGIITITSWLFDENDDRIQLTERIDNIVMQISDMVKYITLDSELRKLCEDIWNSGI